MKIISAAFLFSLKYINIECKNIKVMYTAIVREQGRHGILREHASVVCGRFFSVYGRKCGSH